MGVTACDQPAATPDADDFAASASAEDGAFQAFDEACLGSGDLADVLPRVEAEGWSEFTPPEGSPLADYRELLLEGPAFDRPEFAFLRKNENRATIVLVEIRTLRGDNYIFHCEVYEEAAAGLDMAALEDWAQVPIETRQIDDSPEYQDLTGGRFRNGLGGNATAYFADQRSEYQPVAGLIISTDRSNMTLEGTD